VKYVQVHQYRYYTGGFRNRKVHFSWHFPCLKTEELGMTTVAFTTN